MVKWRPLIFVKTNANGFLTSQGWRLRRMVESIHRKETNDAVREPPTITIISTFGFRSTLFCSFFANFDNKKFLADSQCSTASMSCSSDVCPSGRFIFTSLFLTPFGLPLVFIPLWILPSTFSGLAAGAFCIQFGVQGAWGVVRLPN